MTLPDGVISIGDDTFNNCTELTSINLPSKLGAIEDGAFMNCEKLYFGEIIFPEGVRRIGNYAFYGNNSITKIVIPEVAWYIGKCSFAYCSNLSSVYCKPIEPSEWPNDAFVGNAPGRKIYVPSESLEKYKEAIYWRDFAEDIVGYDFE